ncbi:hypothetical protein M408DRAFT_11570 [Serendipita vermifera MAFF 305830]|uniref:Uncharacterized protein n=1 Tax=Serendipita vermifera MAFF 305830 TaxID=933852 RepID=A0A0C3AFE0_SERVB|nr:hypothetical protein M408DRAFT_11570 [Serendipita vermifera MAFF 305830]
MPSVPSFSDTSRFPIWSFSESGALIVERDQKSPSSTWRLWRERKVDGKGTGASYRWCNTCNPGKRWNGDTRSPKISNSRLQPWRRSSSATDSKMFIAASFHKLSVGVLQRLLGHNYRYIFLLVKLSPSDAVRRKSVKLFPGTAQGELVKLSLSNTSQGGNEDKAIGLEMVTFFQREIGMRRKRWSMTFAIVLASALPG